VFQIPSWIGFCSNANREISSFEKNVNRAETVTSQVGDFTEETLIHATNTQIKVIFNYELTTDTAIFKGTAGF
jgi:hypothetical protein